ncbi:MAG: GNAT family N-acetyltransferase [Methanomassiliicoccales archaeon]|nr:MAG: GNAT family N-acetyltransferase [Methanomassiliicoccales archaeon]
MIRKIIKEDIKEVMPFLQQLWPDTPIDHNKIEEVFNRYLIDDNYEMFCFEEKEILGIITISKRYAFYYGSTVAIIEDLVVDQQNRGKGIGGKLLEFAEKEIKAQGISAIEVASDIHRNQAHLFWEKHGYTRSAYQFKKILDSE